MRYYLIALLCVLVLGIPWFVTNYPDQTKSFTSAFNDAVVNLAAVITHNPRMVSSLRAKYDAVTAANGDSYTQGLFSRNNFSTSTSSPFIRILVVPGHEPNFGGTEFGSLKERDMTVELGQYLTQFILSNPHYEAHMTRDTESWSPDIAQYFKDHWNDIVEWQRDSHAEMKRLISVGSSTRPTSTVYHNSAPVNVALRLYGITKWANENMVDLVIHIHFNDYPNHRAGVAGEHTGFAIYVPAAQYGNSTTTKVIAETIFKRLSKYNAISNLPGESSGIVDEPELIAIGANNTSDAASMLIEYGYIYEPQFINPEIRSMALRDLAYQTYLGLQDFFDPTLSYQLSRPYDTLVLPHNWKNQITGKNAPAGDIYALQTALQIEGLYPPSGKGKNDCPRSGTLGPCTKNALNAFQNKYRITGEKGMVGAETLDILNSQYGVRTL